ncbi:SDR family oxidoreductase [Nocardioides sp.]|uniref:SDR family NAD(P)-dependent oxidoreductase n=1 Tax=Nocardioides sp. TaxID=35761 RepID=UPI0026279041|nr:SDR family oxidoreductase [Nocardioides sp.]MDI6908202.1 SDR family oxidoreductase [Nocardioides sp.]
MDLELDGKRALVTGASKGIGLSLTRALAEHGVHVVAASRSRTRELADLVDGLGVVHQEVDLGSEGGAARAVQRVVDEFGGIDILINNVGSSAPGAGFLSLSDDDWNAAWEINFLSAVRACRSAVPLMVDAGGGSIVNITSLNSRQPHPMVVDYGVTKAALTNFTKALSEEFAPRGVRVNAIAPGFVRTPMWTAPGGFGDRVAELTGSRDASDAIEKAAPEMLGITVGRFAEPEELCGLALLLASDRGAMMTGSEYLVDGGASKTL